MNTGQPLTKPGFQLDRDTRQHVRLHPAWAEFLRFCTELRHGEIERLAIQDGVPVLAELTTRKVKFTQSR